MDNLEGFSDVFDEINERFGESVSLVPIAAIDPNDNPEQFAISTALSLREQQRILNIPLDIDHPLFGKILTAKASVINAQISAQLKADETRLKGQVAAVSYFQEIKDKLAAARLRSNDA